MSRSSISGIMVAEQRVQVCLLTRVIPPPVLSLLLPYLDLASLLHLEATCRLLQEVVTGSGEYSRRFRRLRVKEGGKEINEETRNSEYCKQQLIHSLKLSRQKHYLSDHRVSQNIAFPRFQRSLSLCVTDHRINQSSYFLSNEE